MCCFWGLLGAKVAKSYVFTGFFDDLTFACC
jgi:hypothetical protein